MAINGLTPISNRGFNAQFLSVPYYNPLSLPDVTASIDGVRIKYTYSKTIYDHERFEVIDTLTAVLCDLNSDFLFMEFPMDVRHKQVNFRIGCYAHTLTFSLPDGDSFAVLVGRYTFETSEKGLAAEAVIDFNPNKTMGRGLKRILGILASRALSVSVQRFDLALDFPVRRDTLSLVRRGGSGYQKFVDDQGVITEYTGKRSHHAAIKLYDKGAEFGTPFPLTRLEITIEWDKFSAVSLLMPTILSSAPLEFNLCFAELPFPVKAVLIHPDLYDILKDSVSGNTWRKYRDVFREYGTADFTVDSDALKKIDIYVCEYIRKLPLLHLS